jgi:guanine deaminase
MGSGVLDVRQLLDKGIKVGLGTDVGGGYSTSILDTIRLSLIASTSVCHLKHFSHFEKRIEILQVAEALYLATLGGHQVLGTDCELGNFLLGKKLDAFVMDPYANDSPFDVFEHDDLEDILHKFLFLGDDRNIISVIVDGNQVYERNI